MRDSEKLNLITSDIINAAIEVHKEIGPGLFESIYHKCMLVQLDHMGLNFKTELAVPIIFKGQQIAVDDLRADLLIEDEVVVEIKSVATLLPVHKKQLLTYLRLLNKRVGLLINFNTVLLKDGIERVVNNFMD